jgi:DNA excision repair protein ERCC-4
MMSTAAAQAARRQSPLAAELRYESVTAVIDTRERHPLDLAPLRTITATLTTGDYSIQGLESIVAIERKELGDLLSCVGVEHERFEREVQRLLAYPVRCIVVESTWAG